MNEQSSFNIVGTWNGRLHEQFPFSKTRRYHGSVKSNGELFLLLITSDELAEQTENIEHGQFVRVAGAMTRQIHREGLISLTFERFVLWVHSVEVIEVASNK